MGDNNYNPYEKVLKEELVGRRGQNSLSPKERKILELEARLENAKLTPSELAAIQKQLRELRHG